VILDSAFTGHLILHRHGLSTPLTDGTSAYFNYFWLRDNCPTAFDRQTRERIFDIFAHADDPIPKSASIIGDTLEIIWRNDGHVTRHRLSFLVQYANGAKRADPADLPRRFWYADHYSVMAKFSQPSLLADKAQLTAWIKTLLVEGVAIVTDMPDSDEALTQTARLIGHIRPTFFGEYFDVRTHIAPTNLAYTARALELHTDTPAEDAAPGVQFLHCRANSVQGGDSLFLDGAAAATDLRSENPEDFALLSQTDIPYYCEHDDYDMRARQRVIELDDHGEVSGVTISQHMADMFDLPQDFLDAYYPAFVRFGRMLQRPRYVMRFRLEAGECIVFDNHRIVHGRAAYTAESGERYLRGCYTDRGEMRSRYRALTTPWRFK
jgi:gamma-butyrobetaine dioxygenase